MIITGRPYIMHIISMKMRVSAFNTKLFNKLIENDYLQKMTKILTWQNYDIEFEIFLNHIKHSGETLFLQFNLNSY